jgi:hypothetical protein
MTENLRHWNALGKTDPKQTKPFSRAGGFKGTATKPIWLTMRLTEHFGPCGVGWGMGKPEFHTVAAGDEILVFCTVSLWYIDEAAPETEATVYGVGGDKVLGKNKNGPFTDDEAFKKAYTDALSNAMKQIGVAADVHMGLFEDNKYVRAMEREFAEEPLAPSTKPALAPPPDDLPLEDMIEPKNGWMDWENRYRRRLTACKTRAEQERIESLNINHRLAFEKEAQKRGKPDMVERIRIHENDCFKRYPTEMEAA